MTKLRVLGIQMLNEVIYMYKVIPGVFFFFISFTVGIYCFGLRTSYHPKCTKQL